MSEGTSILDAAARGDPIAAAQLLPLLYDELRKLAAQKLAQEQPGQTLQATALVHEAYLRLVDVPQAQLWKSRGHFFAAAAEAMRRTLVDSARRKQRLKRGGDAQRVDLEQIELTTESSDEERLAVHEVLEKLEREDPPAAALVKLRYFVGLSLTEAAQALGISRT